MTPAQVIEDLPVKVHVDDRQRPTLLREHCTPRDADQGTARHDNEPRHISRDMEVLLGAKGN